MALALLISVLNYFRQGNKEIKKLLMSLFRILAYWIIGSAIIILIYVLVMKFVFNVDLVSDMFYK